MDPVFQEIRNYDWKSDDSRADYLVKEHILADRLVGKKGLDRYVKPVEIDYRTQLSLNTVKIPVNHFTIRTSREEMRKLVKAENEKNKDIFYSRVLNGLRGKDFTLSLVDLERFHKEFGYFRDSGKADFADLLKFSEYIARAYHDSKRRPDFNGILVNGSVIKLVQCATGFEYNLVLLLREKVNKRVYETIYNEKGSFDRDDEDIFGTDRREPRTELVLQKLDSLKLQLEGKVEAEFCIGDDFLYIR